MKKAITFLMSILLVFSLAACGNQADGTSSQTTKPAENTVSESISEISRQSEELPHGR